MRSKALSIFGLFCVIFGINAIFSNSLEACTRVVYIGDNDSTVITGRTMDWGEDMRSNLWAFPRGIERHGLVNAKSPVWKSKYGSLTTSSYDLGTVDGINEEGLVANLLYLVESDYGKPSEDKPQLAISLWAQYVLDNFATVSEAVEVLRQEPFQVVAPVLPDGTGTQLHLSISDPTGDSAIFEYIDGKLQIHHSKQYQVMTNSPAYGKQLALDQYWKSIGGLTFLPGTNRAADRFARASFLLDSLPKKTDPHYITAIPGHDFLLQATASVMGVLRNVSVPLGITTPNQPNISSTLWRTLAEQKTKVYFFDSATSPNTFWIPLEDLNLVEGSPVLKLTLTDGKTYAGNAAEHFVPAPAYQFMPGKI